MYIASQKRSQNIAEYLLYMWQVEDLIRAYHLDMDLIRDNIIARYSLDDSQRKQLVEWYESLIDMMRRENVTEKGHLNINSNVLHSLVDLHHTLLKDPRFPQYTAEFYKTLPYIVEIRSKAGENKPGEIETCLNALYGMLLLRLKGSDISEETQKATAQIARFTGLLAHYFKLEEENLLEKEAEKNSGKDTEAKPDTAQKSDS
ncbi:MAG: DUF4924 family protein [Muribaculaceae bacterium]|nr:DUF4924 family protein [Muribaculaceae bacterium]